MREDIVFAGFGGQGVLFAGQLLAYTALAEGKHVTWIPSYGPEMRGGTANCTVVLSDEQIGSPVSRHPGIAVVFNHPSLEKYEEAMKPGGLLVVNESMIMMPPCRDDIDVMLLAATDIASQLGEVRVANMILMGALLAERPLVRIETMIQVLNDKLGAQKAHLYDINVKALARGQELAATQRA